MKGFEYTPDFRFLVRSQGASYYCRTIMEAIDCARILAEEYGLQSRCYRRWEIEKTKA